MIWAAVLRTLMTWRQPTAHHHEKNNKTSPSSWTHSDIVFQFGFAFFDVFAFWVELYLIFDFFLEFYFFSFGQVKGNARHGRSRHQSFRVCNLASPKVAR